MNDMYISNDALFLRFLGCSKITQNLVCNFDFSILFY